MKQIFILLFSWIYGSFIAEAQTLQMFHEKNNPGYTLYAGNPELFPVTVSLDLKLTNLGFSEGDKTVFVIPPKTEKFRIGELAPTDPKQRNSFSYNFKSVMGDVNARYDRSAVYDLPFQKGKAYKLFQGYNGRFSHQHENALDFTMPEGTELLAAREGLVVQIIQNNTESCPREECKKYNNYITIMHPDGSFANYTHIKLNGARVRTGDAVKRGDLIGFSGNTGWSSGPHLHFACFVAGLDKRNTLETKFRINNGDHAVVLSEGGTYERGY
jgi:murein DD-endopeptidase MepM/ murein hydrolase activator NlpD